VARYMYTHGYDLRHYATMGIVPAFVEMIVRGWWLCKTFETHGEIAPTKAKLTSMLMLAHLIATSGNLLKTGVIFGMNPLALNWAQLLALPPVTLAWIGETLKRNRSIRNKLDEEWISTYQAMPGSLV
jgi:predicted amino acid racemase